MQELQLNSRELLYIASLFDIDELYGISDGFYGMDEAEISAEINNIKKNLNDKGYAEMDFDGNFAIKEDIMSLFEVCVKQDKYISFDKVQKSNNLVIRVYVKDNRVVKITGDNNNYIVRESAVNSIKSDMSDFVDWSEESQSPVEEETFVENELLRKVKKMNEFDDPENELKLMGCSNLKSKILYGGLTGEAGYYSMLIIDFTAESQDVFSLIFINSTNGVLMLEPDLESEKERIRISTVSQAEISKKIADAIYRYIPGAAEEFV